MDKMKKVLITGGAGFIGLHLAKYLADQKYNVTILDNFARGQEDLDFKSVIEKPNVKFIKGDITLKETFDKLDNDYDYIYHLAAINGTGNFYKIPDKVLKVGILGTLNTLDWFIKQKKGKLLFTSSSETYAGTLKLIGDKFPIPTPENISLTIDDPTNVRWSYGVGKIAGEVAMHCYAAAHNMKNFSIIRYHNIYGPRMGFEHVVPQFIERIVKKENPFRIIGWEDTRSFCYIDDAVKATQLVMESEKTNGQTIHIGRDDGEIAILDMAKTLFKVTKTNPKLDLINSPEGSVKRRCPDITKLRNLGFAPKVSLEEGLEKSCEWYKNKF